MSRGISRKALRDLDIDAELPPEGLPDRREQEIQQLTVVDERVLDTLRDVFDGTDLIQDQRKVRLLLKLRSDVGEAWRKTRDAFIEIGRALNDVDQQLSRAERDAFKQGFARLFPFSATVASQFRAIARAVDREGLPRDVVPGSYGAAYQMAMLTQEERAAAGEEGLIRADVSREALIEWRKRRTQPFPRGADGAIRKELNSLRRREQALLEELQSVRTRIGELTSLMTPEPT